MPAWLSDKTTVSVGIVAMVVTLGFWVGGLDSKVGRHEKDIEDLKLARDDDRKILSARLDSMSQDLASIRAKLEFLPIFEIKDPDKRTRRQ